MRQTPPPPIPLVLLCLCLSSLAEPATAPRPAIPEIADRYKIVWTTPGRGSEDSMPLAGGILGLNVWVEDGDLLFLIGSPNCLDEKGMQTKLGLIRLHPEPAVFSAGFRQELDLYRSEITVSGATPGGKPATIRLWCGVFQPVIHAELAAGEPLSLTASYETWSNYNAKSVSRGIQWSRRLPADNPRRLADMKAQGVTEFAHTVPDPLSDLTIGGWMTAPGMEHLGTGAGKLNGMNLRTWRLRTAQPVTTLDLRISLRMEQDRSPEAWESALVAMPDADRAATLAWWQDFWDRSHIVINPGATPDDPVWQVGRNYQLCRYLLAANRNGRAMTLFNGGNFPCTGNPDARNWDGCQFMGQNQRLVYWPMLKAGDLDLLKVAMDFYRDRTDLRRHHARKFWAVDGVTYPEPFSIFGLDAIGTTPDGRSIPDHLHHHYTSGMEFALMMLRACSFGTADPKEWTGPALGIISYYDSFYQKVRAAKTGRPLDAGGRLVIYPSDACEPYHGCTNNTDVIAGLTALTRELLALPAGALPPERITFLKGFEKRLPAFPMKEKDGRKYFAAADSWEWVFENGNMDFPQMYICFPFDHLFLGRDDMSLARNTWELSAIKPAVQHQNQCWYQSAINLARMGDTALAAKYTVAKFHHESKRFPVFYRSCYAGGNRDFCHVPDTDHGGVAMTALQEMLMQTDGRRILLGPAWPREWNCDFKLHAPFQTTVEGRVANGSLTVTKIVPESRRADLVVLPLKTGVIPEPVSQGRTATASSTYHQAGYDPTKAVDGDSATRWASADGARSGWLEVDLGRPTSVSRAVIQEIAWPAVDEFTIEVQTPDGKWRIIHQGGAIGSNLTVAFPTTTARKFRLHLKHATGNLNIEEFQLFTN